MAEVCYAVLSMHICLTSPEVTGSFSRADITEVADRLFDLAEVVEVGLLAAFTEVLESCLKVADLAEAADTVDLMDVEDGVFFAPVTEVIDAADVIEVSETAFTASPTEVVDSCLAVID